MKTSLLLAAGTWAALASAHASILPGFDGLPSGSPANGAAPGNAQFTHAVFDFDYDTYGDDGTLPGFDDIAVRFLDVNGAILSSIPVNQTQPGFQISDGGMVGVAAIVLPAGAFYDDLTWAPVPEPSQWAGIAGPGLLGFSAWRRYSNAHRG